MHRRLLNRAHLVQLHRHTATGDLPRGLAAGFFALLAFVALNPTLYAAPVSGLRAMLNLGGELSRLEQLFPGEALPTLASRATAARSSLSAGHW